MTSDQAITQAQSQQLLITPQLQQSLRILQAGQEELSQLIGNEVMENPLLELEEPVVDPAAAAKDHFESMEQLFERLRPTSPSNTNLEPDAREREIASVSETLQGYLIAQLSMVEISTVERRILSYLIRNLGDDGYLEFSDSDVARNTKAKPAEVVRAIEVLQSLEPAGVGARNLEECLLIQLNREGEGESLAAKVLQRHSKLLSEGRIERIAQLEHVALEKICEAVRTLRSLNPFPGARFGTDAAVAVIPDIIVRESGGEHVALVNEGSTPRVFISTYYENVIARDDDPCAHRYIRKRLQAAQWFLQCIKQRQETLRKVTQCIVDFEKEFLTEGINSLRPLYLKDVASKVGLHESTVSRAIANKYIDTPRGVFELKYFFTSRIDTGNGEVSSLLVKEVIRAMVERENAGKPLSDYKIADALKETSVSIARRTVTKYREEMGIPSAPLRKLQAVGDLRAA